MDTDNERERLTADQINLTSNEKSKTKEQTKDNSNEEVDEGSEGEPCCTKKVKIISGVIVAFLLLAGLGVGLGLGLTMNSDSIPFPDANSIEDVATGSINQMSIDETDYTNDEYTISGTLNQASLSSDQLATLSNLQKRLRAEGEDTINPRLIPQGDNNILIPAVSYMFGMTDYHVAYLYMGDKADTSRYYVPITNSISEHPEIQKTMRLEMLGFKMATSGQFYYSFSDVAANDGSTLLTTEGQTFVFMDKYIQMDFKLPSQRLFGFGERTREFMLTEGTWTMWTKDQFTPYDDGTGGKQSYGVHPFLLAQTANRGDYIGIYFKNSNAQSPFITFNDDGTSILSYITTGGELEIYFFLHKSAKEIVQSYIKLVSNPTLPPFWALGWQQSSYTYSSQELVQEMIDAYADEGMPLETVYLDIYYMDNFQDFTVDTTAFDDLDGLVTDMHANNQHLVVIIDAALSVDDTTNKYYTMANDYGCLIKSTVNPDKYDGNLVAHVWPQQAVFLDWFHPDAYDVWKTGLQDLYDQVAFDGLWLDMDEPSSFCSGECPDGMPEPEEDEQTSRRLSDDETVSDWFYSYADQGKESTYFLPFIPGFHYGGNLDNNTISLNATQTDGTTTYKLYDTHSLYGHMMASATNSFMVNDYDVTDQRPFILARSTFAGSGRWVQHWQGDNWREWEYMRYSIAGLLNFNMFGIPFVGADICGFLGETLDQEMCARWIQLATFYPLARFHYAAGDPGEPYSLDNAWKAIAKASMFDRLHYLRMMYTALWESSQGKNQVTEPLFHYYSDDDAVFDDIEHTFMVGGGRVKVSPILSALEDGVTTFQAYFPAGNWVNLADWSVLAVESSAMIDLNVQDTVNAHLRPGSMIPYYTNENDQYLLATDFITEPISLIFNRDDYGYSEGTVFIDDGISLAELSGGQYEYYQVKMASNSINVLFAGGSLGSQTQTLENIVITNAADLKSADFACWMNDQFEPTEMTAAYDSTTKTLTITPDADLMFSEFIAVYYGDSSVDYNICDPDIHKYVLKSGSLPDLSDTEVSFEMTSLISPDTLGDLTVTMKTLSPNTINIKVQLSDPTRTQFEVPQEIVNPVTSAKQVPVSNFVQIVQDDTDQSVTIQVFGKDGTEVLDLQGFVQESWLNIIKQKTYHGTDMQYFGIFGLGERVTTTLSYGTGVYSMYAKDVGNPVEDGVRPGDNEYGTHPLYMYSSGPGVWTGVYTNLIHPQDWFVKTDEAAGTTDIRTVANGGLADLYVIIGFDPRSVAAQYHEQIVGAPVLPPLFAMGWNQCKWGYATTEDLQYNIDMYQDNSIPLDGQWSDIDYMYSYRDFTVDETRFEGLKDSIATWNEEGIHWIPIIDAGIAYRPNADYQAFDDAIEADIFIKYSGETDTGDLIGEVWPNEASYPDFFKTEAQTYWKDQISTFYETAPFSGLWLDMNEASNFCQGTCSQFSQTPESSVLAMQRYIPSGRELNEKSISVDAVHEGGIYEIEAHSLFGTMQVKAAHQYFVDAGKRTYIIDRSSAAGMGKFGSTWLGDNYSDIFYLGTSMLGAQMMSTFGITMAGADICGFGGNTTPDLCARWTMVGALHPFARNHAAYDSISQEPYQFIDDMYDATTSYMDIMKQGILNRYHILRYYYSMFFLSSIYSTGPFFNPLFYHFPEDSAAYEDYQYYAMIGPALKLSALTTSLDEDDVDFYFPEGTWCDVLNPEQQCIHSAGEKVTLASKIYDVYLHLFEGYIIPMHDATALGVQNTQELATHPTDLHILGRTGGIIQDDWLAMGEFIVDDGLEIEANLAGKFNHYIISAYPVSGHITLMFTMKATATSFAESDPDCYSVNNNDFLGDIYIYDATNLGLADSATYTVSVNYVNEGGSEDLTSATYDATTDRIVFANDQSSICLTRVASILLSPAA